MMQLIITALLLSHSSGISSSCSEIIPLGLNYSKDTVYTYQHKISASTWTKNDESNIKTASNKFNTLLYPYSKTKKGYMVYEVVYNTKSGELLDLIGKRPPKLPQRYLQPIYPVGQIENVKDQNPENITNIYCNQIFTSYEGYNFYDGSNSFSKKDINKVIEMDSIKIAGKKTPVIRIETRKEVTIKGSMNGTGTETTTMFLIYRTNELYDQRTSFSYEYKTGVGKERKIEIIKGEYASRLVGKKKYIRKEPYFPELTESKDFVSYYTNNYGLYVPVELNNSIKTKMYINPTSATTAIDYDYYIKNLEDEPKDYFYPFSSIKIGSSKIDNVSVEIQSPAENKWNLDYKIPGIIGQDIINLGSLIINDRKRQLAFWEPEEKPNIPTKAVPFQITNGSPVFELMVNGSAVKATIGFDCYEPEISYDLKEKLKLKTIKVAIPKGNNPLASVFEKTEIIITPSSKDYFKTSAVIKDFGEDAPYDIKLGLNYIKDKEFVIDYKNGWFSIK